MGLRINCKHFSSNWQCLNVIHKKKFLCFSYTRECIETRGMVCPIADRFKRPDIPPPAPPKKGP
jgi:hypothetical protein